MTLESHLTEFVAIVDEGSVSAAARSLGLPRSSVSRHLARLEEVYDAQLMFRETRRLTLTEAGRQLYQRAVRIVAELEDAQRAVGSVDDVPRGLLRVALPADWPAAVEFAARFLQRYPEVRLELVGGNVHADLVGEGIDVALRGGPIRDESLMVKRLGISRLLLFAAPALIEEYGEPKMETVEDYPALAGVDGLGQPITGWPLRQGGEVTASVRVRTNSLTHRLEGARLGLGMALLPEVVTRPWVERGELVSVLVDEVGMESPMSIVWPQTSHLDPKVRAFIDMMVEEQGPMLRWRSDDSDRPSSEDTE